MNDSLVSEEMRVSTSRRFEAVLMLGFGALVLAIWVTRLVLSWRHPLGFDDAFMFYRYALQMRAGHGFVWNVPDGPAFGPTSLLWTFVVTAFSLLPLTQSHTLILASWIFGLAAIGALAWATGQRVRSPYLRSFAFRFCVLGTLTILCNSFARNTVTGMDTMLALGCNAVMCGLVLRHPRTRDSGVEFLLALCGVVGFIARPDTGLVFVVLVVAFACLQLPQSIRLRFLLRTLIPYAGGVFLIALVCQLYFHTPIPLSFYIKSRHFYDGYTYSWTPITYALQFLAEFSILVVMLVLFYRDRQDSRFAAVFLLPLAISMVYYTFFVLQVMGFASRYYIVLLPFLAVPAWQALDRSLQSKPLVETKHLVTRCVIVAAFFALILASPKLESMYERLPKFHRTYAYVVPQIEATRHLPMIDYVRDQHLLTDGLLKGLPAGETIAGSEIGILGSRNPQLNVIDLSGLNDPLLARHGFSPEAVLQRRPAVIWFPYPDYKKLSGTLYSSPDLIRSYDIYAEAFSFGVAIRKDSPYHDLLTANLGQVWQQIYAGYPMQQYRVTEVRWDPRPIHLN
jgi:hypothetical protein